MRASINLLISGGLLVSGSTPQPGDEFINAVENRDSSRLSSVISEWAHVNHVENRGYSALMLAAAKDQEEIAASILIENDADVNQGVPEFTQYG